MFICNQVAKSREILMFVCLQKDAKQCCDVAKVDRAHCSGRRPAVSAQNNEYDRPSQRHSIVWHLFGDKQTSKSHEAYSLFPVMLTLNLADKQTSKSRET